MSPSPGLHRPGTTFSADGDAWQSVELDYSAYADRWEGALPDKTGKTVFVVQAMDSAGNTACSGNKGQYYGAIGATDLYLPLVLNQARP